MILLGTLQSQLLVLKQTTPKEHFSSAHSHDDVMLTAFYIKQWFIVCKLHIMQLTY